MSFNALTKSAGVKHDIHCKTLTVDQAALGITITGAAHGSVLYVDANGALALLAPGTDGKALITKGAAANPEWAP